jgi:aminopeptidase
MALSFAEKFDNYASLVVAVGLNLQPGQKLVIRAPIEAAPLVRKLAAKAYQAGSPLVDVQWSDDGVTLARFEHAPEGSFKEVAPWYSRGTLEVIEQGGAILSISGSDPDLLKEIDPERIATARKAQQRDSYAVTQRVMKDDVNWCVIAMPTPAWAAKVFPDEAPELRVRKLWEAIFSAVRADRPDPVAAWQRHVEALVAKRDALNERRFDVLRLRAPGTELSVGLPERHRWMSAESVSSRDITFIANMPTEEVFTAPHRERVDGVVRNSRPLSYAGQLIDGFSLTFKGGRVVEAKAERGEKALRKLLETDEGAARLGEVALVAHSSPISQSGMLFYNTLFDENAASHIALGRAYPSCFEGGTAMTSEEVKAAGGNDSLAHVDFMIGSSELEVDGLTREGRLEPIMRLGEWVI